MVIKVGFIKVLYSRSSSSKSGKKTDNLEIFSPHSSMSDVAIFSISLFFDVLKFNIALDEIIEARGAAQNA